MSTLRRSPIVPALAVGLAVGAMGAFTGYTIVRAPFFAWALTGLACAAALLIAPAWIRVAAAVLAATCSRLLVASGSVSSLVNFFHYPLVLCIAIVSAVESRNRSPARRSVEFGVLGLLAISLVSWLANGGEVLRPFLDWLVFSEPLLIVYAIINMPPEGGREKILWALAILLPFIQLPLALRQWLVMGIGDPVQGLFVGMGAGAHVAGAVSLIGSLLCVAKAISSEKWGVRSVWLLGAAVLFFVAVIADAKQVIIAFLPALILLLAISMRLRFSRAIVALPILAVLILGAFSYYRPLQMALDWSLITRGAMGKAEAFGVIASKLSEGWFGWLIGLGPGNSVSRVALMGLEAFVKPDSPVYLLGLGPAATTRELWALTTSNRLFAASSVWTGVSSWLGVVGDFGLAGLGLYAWIFGSLWVNLGKGRVWATAAAKAVLLMMVILGLLFSWLEEPGFTLLAALVVGLGLLAAADARHSGEEPPHVVLNEDTLRP